MEHACHKCGNSVEDGIPFCAHCGAPQIRVFIPEPIPAATSAPERALAGSNPVELTESASALEIAPSTRWSYAMRPCVLAALIAGMLMGVGLNALVGMFCAGILGVALYRSRLPGAAIKIAIGAQLGAISGLFCFALSIALESITVTVFHKGAEVRKAMLDVIQQAASRTGDPQTLAMFEYLKTPTGLAVMMAMGLMAAFVASIIVASLGGMLGASFFRHRDRK